MALITLPKILYFLNPGQQLIVLDDGTLTEESVDTIHQLSDSTKVITRKQREEFIVSAIGNRPNCLKYREEFPLAFKLIDVPLSLEGANSRFTFTDTDIIYLKNSGEYFGRESNTYLRTDAIKLSVKLQNAIMKYKWRIPFKFNSGFFSYEAKDFDLDFVEYYLGLPDIRHYPWLSEQTCWALLFARSGASSCPLEEQFVCREDFGGPTPETLAIHLIGPLKGKLGDWSKQEPVQGSEYPYPEFEASRDVTLLDWTKKSIRRFSPFSR